MGLDRAREDPYHEFDNPNGVIQVGLAENRLSLDMIEKWVAENWELSMGSDGQLGINGIAPYQPSDGIYSLKVVSFMIFGLLFWLLVNNCCHLFFFSTVIVLIHHMESI